MPHILTNFGEEWVLKHNVNGATVRVFLYNDATDLVQDNQDYDGPTGVNISTEPTGGNYAQQSDTITAETVGGEWGFNNNTQLTFDFSLHTTSKVIDSWGMLTNFHSTITADDTTLAAPSHMIATGALSQNRDIGSIDTLNIAAGGVGITLT